MPKLAIDSQIHSSFFSGACALVTGGAGFIGSHLVKRLLMCGARVVVADYSRRDSKRNLDAHKGEIDRLDLDLTRWPEAQESLPDINSIDFIFHLAGSSYVPHSIENPESDFRQNAEMTFNLLNWIRTHSRRKSRPVFLNFSSAAVYGNPVVNPIREFTPLDPISPYGVSKLAGERYAAVFSAIYAARTASLRPFSCYGPKQAKQVVFDVVGKLLIDPERISIIGDGNQARDFVFVEDVVSAAMLVAEKGQLKGEAYNVGSGISHSILELVQHISRILEIDPRLEFTGSVRAGEPDKWACSIDRLQALGFASQYALEDGLRRTIEWVKKHYAQRQVSTLLPGSIPK